MSNFNAGYPARKQPSRKDERLEVLANLTRVLGDEELIGQLSETSDRSQIINHLSGTGPAGKAPATKAGLELPQRG